MADDKAGTGKGGARPSSKAGRKSDPKKPTAIIDLKATEVANKDQPDAKASDKEQPKAPATGKSEAGKVGADLPETKPAASAVPPTAKPPTPAQPSTADKTAATASSSPSAAPSPAKPTTGAGSAKDGDKKDAKSTSGPADSKKPETDKSPPPQRPEARSGGGMWSVLTHLAAGIVGGAVVLFGAQSFQEQSGAGVDPQPAVPAEISSRLSALESRPTAPGADEIQALTTRVAAAEDKLIALDDLQQKVTELAAQPPANQAAAGGDGADAAGELAGDLKLRLDKLEQTLETLANATTGTGSQVSLGEIATLSGKLADLESTLNNQIASLRDSVTKELDERVTKTAEASAAAQAGTQRLDRELATVKTEAARLAQRTETQKAAQESLSQAVRIAREESAKLRVDLDGLKGDVLQQFKTVARANDVTTALKPVGTRVDGLEAQLKSVVESEAARKASAQRIVVALELGNLKRSLDRGDSYASELAEVKRIAGSALDLASLEKFQSEGVPTAAELKSEFTNLAYAMIRADDQPADGTMFDRLIGGARSLVRVRRADLPASDTSTEATVARMEKRLQQGDLAGVLGEAERLSDKARQPAQSWLDRVAARAEVDRAIAAIEQQLKSTLGSSTATKG